MSHFSLWVIGDDYESQLNPFQENNMGDCPAEYLVFDDRTADIRDSFATGSRKSFRCDTSSSHGRELKAYDYLSLKDLPTGDEGLIVVADFGFTDWQVGNKEKCHHPKFTDGDEVWVETMNVLRSAGVDDEAGKEFLSITVRRIDAPLDVSFLDFYGEMYKEENGEEGTYEEVFQLYALEWEGVEPNEDGNYGHWRNLNAKWHWYEIGGRWENSLCTKSGKKVNQCVFGELSVNGMEIDAAAAAFHRYDEYEYALNGLPHPPEFAEFREQFGDIDNARAAYREIPSVAALRQNGLYGFGSFIQGREKYLKAQEYSWAPHAFLLDGEWVERSEMNWRGMAFNQNDDYITKIKELLQELPPCALITVIDCHT